MKHRLANINKNIFLALLMAYLSISPLIIALLYNVSDRYNWFILREALIYSFFCLLPFMRRTFRVNFICLFFPVILVVIWNFSISYAVPFSKLASIRQIISPFVFIIIAYWFTRNEADYRYMLKSFVLIGLFLLLFGFFERTVYLWSYLDITTMFRNKGIISYSFGYPFFFIEPVRIGILNHIPENTYGTVRMVSSVLDPISLGHTLVFIFTMLYYERHSIRMSKSFINSMLFLMLCAILLTFSKGALVQLFLVFVVLNKKITFTRKAIAFSLFVPIFYIFIIQHAGFMIHFRGFVSVFSDINLFGYGLATYGNYASMFNSGVKVVSGVGDSFWGSLLGQLGLIGFLLWLFPFYVILKTIGFSHYLGRLLVAQLSVAAVSENTFNMMSVAFLSVAVGAYYRLRTIKHENSNFGN